MFNENYPFFSGSSSQMKDHFRLYSEDLKKMFSKTKVKIIEIGSNDGTMLKNFDKDRYDILGFEPSKNVSDKANSNGVNSLNQFFNQKKS